MKKFFTVLLWLCLAASVVALFTMAGEKASMSDEARKNKQKYDALKNAVAEEIGSDNNALIQVALEDDPARVMSTFDIFTVEFDKSSRSFGSITQLTDDVFYDDYPQAIYDQETGDYIVVYYKTAQDTEAYTGGGDKLTDLVGVSADPNKTYSLLCYMLYNNQTNAEDTKGQTHAAGWARTYYFPNETAELISRSVHGEALAASEDKKRKVSQALMFRTIRSA